MTDASSFQEAFEKSVKEKKGKTGYTLVTSGTANGCSAYGLARRPCLCTCTSRQWSMQSAGSTAFQGPLCAEIAILAQELGIADQVTSIPLPLQGEQKEPWVRRPVRHVKCASASKLHAPCRHGARTAQLRLQAAAETSALTSLAALCTAA